MFDCKFTKYSVSDELTNDGVKFITLRKRSPSLIEDSLNLTSENWQKVFLPIPKRKYQRVSVHETEIILKV